MAHCLYILNIQESPRNDMLRDNFYSAHKHSLFEIKHAVRSLINSNFNFIKRFMITLKKIKPTTAEVTYNPAVRPWKKKQHMTTWWSKVLSRSIKISFLANGKTM